MDKYKNKIKSLYLKLRSNETNYEIKGVRPDRDWGMILVFSQLVTLILAGVALYFYIQIDNSRIFTIEKNSQSSEVTVSKVLLKKLVDDYKKREDSTLLINSTKAVPTDPAI